MFDLPLFPIILKWVTLSLNRYIQYKELFFQPYPIPSSNSGNELTGETEHENSELRMWAASEWSTFRGVPGLSREGSLQQSYTYEY